MSIRIDMPAFTLRLFKWLSCFHLEIKSLDLEVSSRLASESVSLENLGL